VLQCVAVCTRTLLVIELGSTLEGKSVCRVCERAAVWCSEL